MIPLFKPFLSNNIASRLQKVFNSGFIGEGQEVKEFELILSNYFENPFVCTTNSCTSALHLAHVLNGSKKVITFPLTCFATNVPILHAGCEPIWVDVDPDTLNPDLEDLRNLSADTMVVVHWGGTPVDLDAIKSVFSGNIIEDCAHAFGAVYKGKLLGNHGNICCFSFQAIKHLTTGDGGLLVCANQETCERAKKLRWYGINRDNRSEEVTEIGFKYHMNNIAATMGIENFKHVGNIIHKHKFNANFYNTHLKNIDGIKLLKRNNCCQSSYWLYTIQVERRSAFEEAMKSRGIETGLYHSRNDLMPCLARFRRSLPKLDSIYDKLTNIPVGWWVTKENREFIVESIRRGW